MFLLGKVSHAKSKLNSEFVPIFRFLSSVDWIVLAILASSLYETLFYMKPHSQEFSTREKISLETYW